LWITRFDSRDDAGISCEYSVVGLVIGSAISRPG
jgi:hypothetical protein